MVLVAALLLLPSLAASQGERVVQVLVPHWASWLALGAFGVAYLFVVLEDRTRLRKSIPMILAAGVLWILVALSPVREPGAAELSESLFGFAELFLFILAAMSFVNTLEERQVFDVLRAWLIKRGLSLRGVFWATGALAFCMSPFADNLTTALVMGAVALSVGARSPGFVVPACINIVVAANAGGAFSPFGDITTLMVWQQGKLEFFQFLRLFLPALVTWLVPAVIMSFTVPREMPAASEGRIVLLPGARPVVVLFFATIFGTVILHQVLGLPAALGMMTGFGVLHLYGYALSRRLHSSQIPVDGASPILDAFAQDERPPGFDLFSILARVEWDTLMFFYGVIMCVGALHAFGFLDVTVHRMFASLGPTTANVVIGLASAVFDNIPLMAAILAVSPEMNDAQWLLVTLTTGVGGSLLSVGSAAGVALMGQARGIYTFGAHLKWTWAVALGYAVSVATHVVLNGR